MTFERNLAEHARHLEVGMMVVVLHETVVRVELLLAFGTLVRRGGRRVRDGGEGGGCRDEERVGRAHAEFRGRGRVDGVGGVVDASGGSCCDASS